MYLGGVERSLLGLLDSIDYDRYDVDLFLMRHSGELMPYLNHKANILPVFRKKYVKYRPELIVQCAITAAMMFMSYLVMANYNVSMYITWGIMTGWTNALIRGYKR